MSPRSRTSVADDATPALRIAAEVRAACDAPRRAVATGRAVHDDIKLGLIADNLAVVASDLALVDRDLRAFGR